MFGKKKERPSMGDLMDVMYTLLVQYEDMLSGWDGENQDAVESFRRQLNDMGKITKGPNGLHITQDDWGDKNLKDKPDIAFFIASTFGIYMTRLTPELLDCYRSHVEIYLGSGINKTYGMALIMQRMVLNEHYRRNLFCRDRLVAR